MKGRKAATIADVAERAGVSRGLVSQLVNGSSSVRAAPETRQRVLRAARELAYTPNHTARALRAARSGAIALIVPDVNSAIFSELLRGVEEAADAAGFVVLLGHSERLEPGSPALRRLVDERRVDGYVLQARDELSSQPLPYLIEQNASIVLVNSWRTAACSSAVLDDAAAAHMATEHLLQLGHERIAMISGLATNPTARRREAGFRTAMRGAGARVPDGWIARAGYTVGNGDLGLREVMSARRRPTAVVVANVNAALGALHAARTIGLQVPSDLSIVALHDIWIAEYSWQPLTCVRMPLYELGLRSVELLKSRLGGEAPRDIVISEPPPKLIARGSTAPPP